MADGFKNIKDWQQAFSRVRVQIGEGSKKAVEEAALYARDKMRERIPPGAATSNFPGYAATGQLKNAIVASQARQLGKEYVARVGLSQSAPRILHIKAFVHEYGMVIRAKNGPYLIFQVQGKWVSVPQVTIRPKHFIAYGWRDARERFTELIFDRLSRNWRR